MINQLSTVRFTNTHLEYSQMRRKIVSMKARRLRERLHLHSRVLLTTLIIFSVTGLAQGLEANRSIEDSVVAVVGGKAITVGEFSAGYEFGPAFPKKEKNSKKVYLNYMINEKLFALDGAEKHLDTTQTFRELFADLQADLATEELYKKEVMPKISLTDVEIESAITKKNTDICLRWIFSKNKEEIQGIQAKILKGNSFDSLFSAQLNDSLFRSDWEWKTNKFKLWQRNPALAGIVDSLHVGSISLPIQVGDGWYIVSLDSLERKISLGEGDYLDTKLEVSRALTSSKLNAYSDRYVDSLMRSTNPKIDGKAYQIIRAYVARYELSKDLFAEWGFQKLSDKAYADLTGGSNASPASLPLVRLSDTVLTIGDFTNWYSQRVDYLNIIKSDRKSFSANVESLIWRMVRDNILTVSASREHLTEAPAVRAQLSWWKDKILYALVREEMKNSIEMKNAEKVQTILQPQNNNDMSTDITKVLFRRLAVLKSKYKITINETLLKKIAVQDENNSNAADMYIVKKGGIYPHPAFPSIDKYWQMWE